VPEVPSGEVTSAEVLGAGATGADAGATFAAMEADPRAMGVVPGPPL
jgi:hypothetical protein